MQSSSAASGGSRFARSGDVTRGDGAAPIPPWPGENVEVGGRCVYVRRAGHGPPALLVHGLGGSSTNWTDLMGELAPDLACTALDLPGFGRSAPPANGRYGLDTHVAAVAALAETLGGPVHVFGNSTGGAVATRLAAQRPDLVRSLVLVSPALPVRRPHTSPDAMLALLLVPGVAQVLLRQMRAAAPAQRARRTLELCYGDPAKVHPSRLEEAVEEAGRRADLPWTLPAFAGTLRGLIRTYVEPGPRNLWAQAARVAAPVLVVTGDRDRLVPVSVARRAARTFPDCRLEVLPGVGHVAQMEAPERVAEICREFLA